MPLAYTLPVVAALLLAGCALDTEDPCGRLLHSGNVSSWASDVTNMGGDIKAGSVECWCDERRRTTCLYTDHRRCQRQWATVSLCAPPDSFSETFSADGHRFVSPDVMVEVCAVVQEHREDPSEPCTEPDR